MNAETIQMIEDAKPIAVALCDVLDAASGTGFQHGALLVAMAAVAGDLVAKASAANGRSPADTRALFNTMVDNAQAGSLARTAAKRH
jgi:hypothetical protein